MLGVTVLTTMVQVDDLIEHGGSEIIVIVSMERDGSSDEFRS
jgi:hypothetical protein